MLVDLVMKLLVTTCACLPSLLVAFATATAATDQNKSESSAQSANAAVPRPSTEQIAAWIAQLDDNRYLERELATRNLLAAGDAALDRLLVAANGDKPEPADRAVWVLRRIAETREVAIRRQALERLAQLQNRPQVAAGALEALAQIRHDEAIAAIEKLGGRYIRGEFPMQYGQYMTPRVELDRAWRGGDEGMAHFRDLVGVPQVILIGANVSANGIAELQQVADLESVWLYGTKLTEADLPKIKNALPHVSIDYRRGGLLGVGSIPSDNMGPATVGHVQPGSAAAEAGIQVGDIIKSFQGEPVKNFEALTKMIGRHAQGDEVTLQALRGDKIIDFKVKLGEWKTAN